MNPSIHISQLWEATQQNHLVQIPDAPPPQPGCLSDPALNMGPLGLGSCGGWGGARTWLHQAEEPKLASLQRQALEETAGPPSRCHPESAQVKIHTHWNGWDKKWEKYRPPLRTRRHWTHSPIASGNVKSYSDSGRRQALSSKLHTHSFCAPAFPLLCVDARGMESEVHVRTCQDIQNKRL